MFFKLILLALVGCTISKPVDISDPAVRAHFTPDELTYLNGLTAEDKIIILEAAQKYDTFVSVDAMLDFIKGKSANLADRMKKVIDARGEKMVAMIDTPEAAGYAVPFFMSFLKSELFIEAGVAPSADELKAIMEKGKKDYDKLSAKAKEDLKKAFPVFATLFA